MNEVITLVSSFQANMPVDLQGRFDLATTMVFLWFRAGVSA